MIGTILLVILLSVLTVYFSYFSYGLFFIYSRKRNYWKNKKVIAPPSRPIFGNYGDYITLKTYFGEVAQKLCQAYADQPYIGTFYGTEPALLVMDPELIKLIFNKDYYYFSNREISKYADKEVFTRNLFFTYGDRWKVIRQNMTPIFTPAKMKSMFHLIKASCHSLEEVLDKEMSLGNIIEIRALTSRYTVESLGAYAFGVDMKCIKENYNNPYMRLSRMILKFTTYSGLKWIWRGIWPAVFYGLGLKAFDTEIDTLASNFLKGVYKSRDYKPTSRNDFIDNILSLKVNDTITGDSITNMKPGAEKKTVDLELDDDLLVSLCLVFFAAGFDTSSANIAYVLYELAKNPEAQKKVHDEIDEYLRVRGNKLAYDCVNSLPYTEACSDEALRMYPVLGLLTREVVEDYTFPTGLTLEKEMRVHIPVYYLHNNPDYFPEPEKFKPERFYGEARKNIKPFTYMPFGEGPRTCIGMRFAKIQIAAGLVTILKKFSVELAEGTPKKLTFEPRSIVTMPIGGIRLKFTAREGWEQRVLQK